MWLDPDADGTRAGTEAGRFGGVTVDLLDSNGKVVAQTTTGPDGSYTFENVPDGSYTVDVTDDANVLAGYWHSIGTDSAPDPTTVTVGAGTTSATIDFGYYTEPAVVGDFVFNDNNSDGLQNGGDTPAPGVVVTLTATYPNTDVVTATTVTAADGSYSFGNLLNDEDYAASGGVDQPTFVLTVTYPDGSVATLSNQRADDAADSDDGVNGEPAEVVQGGFDDTNDFGFIAAPKSASFADFLADNAALFGLDDNSNPGVPATDPLTGDPTGSTETDGDDFGGGSGLTGNPEGDVYGNLLEFALCFDPASGAKVFPSGARNEGFHLELNGSSLDAKFNKPAGVTDVTYEVEISTDGQTWTTLTGITPTEVDGPVNGSKTVTYAGLDTSSPGILRLKVIGTGAVGSTVSAVTGPVGWQTANIKDFCQIYAGPLLNPCLVTGTISGVTGSVLDLTQAAGSQSLTTVLTGGASYYIEIMGGD